MEVEDLTVSEDSPATDEVATVVLGVTLSVGDRVTYDVENVLSDIVTVVGVAVGTGEIETAEEELELNPREDDLCKEDDTEVPKLWLLERSLLLLEDTLDSDDTVPELTVHDVHDVDVGSGPIEDPSEEDDST